MRQIKFRRRDTESGDFVYGSSVEYAEALLGSRHWIVPLDDHRSYPVDPESIAQLVGVDSNGREVYEDDILLDELEQEHVAEIYDRPSKISALTLKEAES